MSIYDSAMFPVFLKRLVGSKLQNQGPTNGRPLRDQLSSRSSKIVEVTKFGACEKLPPLCHGKSRDGDIRIASVANEYELTLSSDSYTGATFTCSRNAPVNILEGRRIYRHSYPFSSFSLNCKREVLLIHVSLSHIVQQFYRLTGTQSKIALILNSLSVLCQISRPLMVLACGQALYVDYWR